MAYGGLLHQDLARPLTELYEKYDISFSAFILKVEDKNSVKQPKRPNRLSINLYGAKENSKPVGDILDQASIFLQHPLISDPIVPYFNPHYLVRPNGTYPAPIPELQIATASGTSLKLSTNQELKSSVFQALDCSAQGPSQYSQTTQSALIRTTLKP